MASSNHTTRPANALQEQLNLFKNRPQIRHVPTLNQELLKRARNSVPHSYDNNDLLEFIGDRAVNLVSAILVEKRMLSKAHLQAVRRVVCNNDTFARLAFYLKFHEHAVLDSQSRRIVEAWYPTSREPPPKVLGDLFEAYTGAVYIQYGWSTLERWLEDILGPIIKAATADFWNNSSAARIFGPPIRPHSKPSYHESRTQAMLLDYIYRIRHHLGDGGLEAVKALPESTAFRFTENGWLEEPDCERIEVGIQLINMWICQIVIEFWPEYYQATAKAAHFLTAITGLIISERVMAYLGKWLSLADYFASKSSSINNYDGQLAITLKATIGWYFHSDPVMARAWGEKWFRPVVFYAHDIFAQDHGFRPKVPREYIVDNTVTRNTTRAPNPSPSNSQQDLLSDLVNKIGALDISSAFARDGYPPSTDNLNSSSLSTSDNGKSSSSSRSDSPLNRTKWRPIGLRDTSGANLSSDATASPSESPSSSEAPTPVSPPLIASSARLNASKWRPIGAGDVSSTATNLEELSSSSAPLSVLHPQAELTQSSSEITSDSPDPSQQCRANCTTVEDLTNGLLTLTLEAHCIILSDSLQQDAQLTPQLPTIEKASDISDKENLKPAQSQRSQPLAQDTPAADGDQPRIKLHSALTTPAPAHNGSSYTTCASNSLRPKMESLTTTMFVPRSLRGKKRVNTSVIHLFASSS